MVLGRISSIQMIIENLQILCNEKEYAKLSNRHKSVYSSVVLSKRNLLGTKLPWFVAVHQLQSMLQYNYKFELLSDFFQRRWISLSRSCRSFLTNLEGVFLYNKGIIFFKFSQATYATKACGLTYENNSYYATILLHKSLPNIEPTSSVISPKDRTS